MSGSVKGASDRQNVVGAGSREAAEAPPQVEPGSEIIRVEDLHVSFGEKQVLNGLNLSIRRGDSYVLIGPSGCGKSVLLRHIMGLMEPQKGRIFLWGQDIVGISESELFPFRRRMAIVFQEGALLNSMTVEQNIALTLTTHFGQMPDERIREIVNERLSWVGLADAAPLRIGELSGGMKKRVAIARGIATDPEIIFYDEPTTGLDPPLADTIDDLIWSLAARLKNTSLTVTHDLVAAKYFGTRIGFFHDGKIAMETTPDQLKNVDDQELRRFITRKDHHED